MKKIKVGVLVGSLRKDSYTKAIANWFTKQHNDEIEWVVLEIGQLPLYNQDYDEQKIESYDLFRDKVKNVDAYLFLTPEYNRSIPAVLKNAIDIASRPYGQNVWAKKPGAIVSQSIGNIGGFGSNHHLRQVLSFVDVYTMQQPECYISNSSQYIDEKGNIAEKTIGFLNSFLNEYIVWVKRFVK